MTASRVAPAGKTRPRRCQFERQGYFARDPDSKAGRLVFNVGLRDSYAKIADK